MPGSTNVVSRADTVVRVLLEGSTRGVLERRRTLKSEVYNVKRRK